MELVGHSVSFCLSPSSPHPTWIGWSHLISSSPSAYCCSRERLLHWRWSFLIRERDSPHAHGWIGWINGYTLGGHLTQALLSLIVAIHFIFYSPVHPHWLNNPISVSLFFLTLLNSANVKLCFCCHNCYFEGWIVLLLHCSSCPWLFLILSS